MDDIYDLEFDQLEKSQKHYVTFGINRSIATTHAALVKEFKEKAPTIEIVKAWSVHHGWDRIAERWDIIEESKKPNSLPADHPQNVNNQNRPSKLEIDPVNADNPTIESQLIKCRRAMNIAFKQGDMKMYHQYLKLECELGGLLIRKESIIVKNIDGMTRDELAEARIEVERQLKLLDDKKTIEHEPTAAGNGEAETN